MCPVFDVGLGELTTNATPNTALSHVLFLTIANQFPPAMLQGWIGGDAAAAVNSSGISVQLQTFATAGSGGTAFAPASTWPGLTASTAVTTPAYTAGGSGAAKLRGLITCGKGGPGAWQSPSPTGTFLAPNGGANGNLEAVSYSAEASLKFRFLLSFNEGVY
jgi:hypothetical protein